MNKDELLMKNHIIRFEDYQNATGYQRDERVNYFDQSKTDEVSETELSSDSQSESLVSVESQNSVALRTELDAMVLAIDQRNGDTNQVPIDEDSDKLENEIMFGDLNRVDSDMDESVVVQNVVAIDYSEKMLTTKSQSTKVMDNLHRLFKEEAL